MEATFGAVNAIEQDKGSDAFILNKYNMKNYQRYKRFKDLFEKLKQAINIGNFFEAIVLEYNLFEDRTASLLAILNINIYKNEKEIGIKQKIAKIKNLNNDIVKNTIDFKLLDDICEWTNKRNIIIHNFLKTDDYLDVEDYANEGYRLAIEFNNKSSQVIKYYKKENDKRSYYMLRKDCYIRLIDNFGYIKSIGLFNDLVLDKSGAIFIKFLKRYPRSLEELSKCILKEFNNAKLQDILNDAKEFYDMLVDDGYVIKGRNISETRKNNIGFNYLDIDKPKLIEDYTPKIIRSTNNSQIFLDNYFIDNPYLSSFQIEITSKCNERCVHCYIPHENKNTDIKEELYINVLNQLEDMGTMSLTLSGGEPMMHPKFVDFIRIAKKKGFFVHVLSNLTLLDDNIIKELRKGNTCAVQVSLYSTIPEHHDVITKVNGSFAKTMAAIEKLIKNDIPVQISCPVMKANKDDVKDVILWGREHKIRVNTDYSIMAKYNHDKSNLSNRLTPIECKKVIQNIIEADDDYRNLINDINNTNYKNNPEEPFCGVGINTCCMVANGNVYPCPGWQGYVCGNLNKNSLKEIWNNSEKIKYLRSLKKKDMKKCLNCSNRKYCAPCLSRFANESETGNPLEIANHFCKVASINKKVVEEWITKTVKN